MRETHRSGGGKCECMGMCVCVISAVQCSTDVSQRHTPSREREGERNVSGGVDPKTHSAASERERVREKEREREREREERERERKRER